MIGLDTNVLARYYIDDHTDVEAQRQRLIAQHLIDSGQPLVICLGCAASRKLHQLQQHGLLR
jgi:hypothetical protein